MDLQKRVKFQSYVEFWDSLPESERIMVDVLRQIIKTHIPKTCVEKLSYNVPSFYGRRRICLIWPASIARGGIRSGVLLGFWQGFRLPYAENYLLHGNNKQIFYKIYQSADEIDEHAISCLLKEAVEIDLTFKTAK